MCICQKNNGYLFINIRKEQKNDRHCIFCFNCKCLGCYCFINNYLCCFLQKDNSEKCGNQEGPLRNCDIIERLLREYFELVENDKLNRAFISEQHRVIVRTFNCLEKYINPQPYKFKDFRI